MHTDRNELLEKAVEELNNKDYPFYVTAREHSLVAHWRWRDKVEEGVHREDEFTIVYDLGEDGTYTVSDIEESASRTGRASGSYSMNFGSSIHVAKDEDLESGEAVSWNENDEPVDFSSEKLHRFIAAYLARNGYHEVQKFHFVEVPKNSMMIIVGAMFTIAGTILSVAGERLMHAGAEAASAGWLLLWMASLFLPTGIYVFFMGMGKAKAPVFTCRSMLAFSVFVMLWTFFIIFKLIAAPFGM